MTHRPPQAARHSAGRRVAVPHLAAPPSIPTGAIARLSGSTMGTTWAVSVVTEASTDLAALQRVIERELDAVDTQMSTWRDDSDLMRFNQGASGSSHLLPQACALVFGEALRIAALTGGAYDPTVGPLVNLWGFGPAGRRHSPPSEDTIAEARETLGWSRIQMDTATRRVVQPGGLFVDFSGIAKGYAVDAVANRLARLGHTSALVDIGGELRGLGVKPDGEPWWVEFDAANDLLIALCESAVATSGDGYRFFEHGGRRYAHTIDPRTGRPVDNGVRSVTVLHPSAMTADALATALTVLGVDEGLRLCDREGIAALIVSDASGLSTEHASPAFTHLLS